MDNAMAEAMARLNETRLDWWMDYTTGGAFRVRLFRPNDTTGRPVADVTDPVSLPAAINNAVDLAKPVRTSRRASNDGGAE
jgi:hypothetical protein